MDSHPHPAAAAGAALVVPDASALRALSDSDALHTLDTYLWGAMQLSAILRERLLHDSKERDTSTSSLHKPGPRPDALSITNDRRDTRSAGTRPRSPGLPFAANTIQERILLPPPRILPSPPSHWPGPHSTDNNAQSASSSSPSTSAGMKHYPHDIAGGSGGVSAVNDLPNHGNDRLTATAIVANSTSYFGASQDERYNNNANSNNDGAEELPSSATRMQKTARRSSPISDPTADELLLTTAYGPDHDTQQRGMAGPSSGPGSVPGSGPTASALEYPLRRGPRDENNSVGASSPTISYVHHRSRANTISSMLDDSIPSPTPLTRRGAVVQQSLGQTHVVDQHLMDLREDLQASRRDRQQLLPHQHQHQHPHQHQHQYESASSARYGHMSPLGGGGGIQHHHGHGGQQRLRSRSPPPSRNGEFVHRSEYDEGARYGRPIPPSQQQQPTSSATAPVPVVHPPQPGAQLPPPIGPQHQQQQQPIAVVPESNIPTLGRKVTPALTVNALGQRTCQQCHQPGRYKDGRCIEKWGPGPAGPGTVCDRCRKRMKRVERRSNHEANLSRQSAAQAQVALTDPQQRPYSAFQQQQQMQSAPPGALSSPQVQQVQQQQQQHNPPQRPTLSMTIPPAQNYEQLPPFTQQQQQQQQPHHGHGHLSQMRRPSVSISTLTPASGHHSHHFSPLHGRDRFERERELERAGRMVVDRNDDDRGVEDRRDGDDRPRGPVEEEDEEDELMNDDYPYAKRFGSGVPPIGHHAHAHSHSRHHHQHHHSHSQIFPPTSSSRSSLPESQERFEQRPLPPYAPPHHHDSSPRHHQQMYDHRQRPYGYDSRSRSRSRSRSLSRSRSRSRSRSLPAVEPVLMMRGRSPRFRSPARLTRPVSRSRSRSPSRSRSRSRSRSPPLPLNGPHSASDTLTLTGTSPPYASSVRTEETVADRERASGVAPQRSQHQQRGRKGTLSLSSPTTSVLGKRRSPPTIQDREREREQGGEIGEEASVIARKASLFAAQNPATSSPNRGRDTPPSSTRRESLTGDFVMVEQ